MKISADFTVIPDDFAKAAAPEYFNGGVPVVSFPFYIDDVDPEARYLHWESWTRIRFRSRLRVDSLVRGQSAD